MKILENLIGVIYWIWTFISPFLILSLIGFLIWIGTEEVVFLYLFCIVGIGLGIYFAESVRKQGGAVKFMGKLYSNTEFDENDSKRNDKS